MAAAGLPCLRVHHMYLKAMDTVDLSFSTRCYAVEGRMLDLKAKEQHFSSPGS